MTQIDLETQVQGILRRLHGGTGTEHGEAWEQLLVPMVNDSGGALALGNLVARTAGDPRLQKTTATGQAIMGIVAGRLGANGEFEEVAPAAGDTVAVCVAGRVNVLTSAAATRNQFLQAGSTAGQAVGTTASVGGSFGVVLYAMSSSMVQALIGGGGTGGGMDFGTPAIVLGTAAAAGSINEAIRRDSTILAFDATVPTTIVPGDSAAAGASTTAARRSHTHGYPAPYWTFHIRIDGRGGVPSAGVVALMYRFYAAHTLLGWDIGLDLTGSCQLDLWKKATYPPAVGDTMVGAGNKPAVTTALQAVSQTPTAWTTTTIAAGDYLRINLDSATTATVIELNLKMRRDSQQ